jgi:GNAT superfamily N-acetyltransferase
MAVDVGMTLAPRDGSTLVRVTELDRVQWRTLRKIRLAALRDSPDAFVTSLTVELRLPADRWLARFDNSTWVIARDSMQTVGIACLAAPDAGFPAGRFVESVWVEPLHRWQGVLRKMMMSLEEHARKAGAEELLLWVLGTNDSARDAYLKLGFELVDGRAQGIRPLGGRKQVNELLMIKPLL